MSDEDDAAAAIKAGHSEVLEWPGYKLSLYWEVWTEVRPLRPCFIVELEAHHGHVRAYKAAYDVFADARADFANITRKHAVEIAMVALRIDKH